MLNKVKNIIKNPSRLFSILSRDYGLFKWMGDELYLKIIYKSLFGEELDLNNPITFNQKLQWLKLNNRYPEMVRMVDKYDAKEYVSGVIGEEYIIPTYGVWKRFDDIDFGSLPNQFVLKCTHDSGGLVICKDKSKLDMNIARKKINKCLKRNYYWFGREWPYKNVKPRIIAEKYMVDEAVMEDAVEELTDYKLMCFNGRSEMAFTCTDRYDSDGLKVTFFDRDWNKLPFERHYPSSKKSIPKPKNYEKMIELSEVLSKGIPFIRVDFYESNDKIYFGELTFYPGTGLEEFTPEIWDKKLGDMIDLTSVREALSIRGSL